ncbi:MAG: sulfatase-like hydrolase/transferase [Flavobacteriales bacterium]
MRHILTLVSAILLSFGALAQQPNILLIIADDLGLDPVPNYLPGPLKAAMPNLEGLMANGLTFENVWADPLCSPTRATIITGRYGFRTGVLNANAQSLIPPSEVILHCYLNNIGSSYATSLIGKWHLGGQMANPNYPTVMGVPHYAGLLAGAVSDYYAWNLTVNGVQTPRTDYITTAITDLGIEWIGQQTDPWFCWLAYTAPHTPFHLPPLNMHTQGALPTDQASITANPLPYYLAMVESLDFEIGRLFASIPASELANTVIIFIGDNGTDRNVIQAPHAMNHGKGTLYEGGVNVPMVISGPGVTRIGEREAALVNSTDLFTTIIELTGEALPVYEDSRSLVPMLSQSGQTVRDCMYAEVDDLTTGHANRNARYKLISFANGTEAFFDLQTDPWEPNELLAGGLDVEQQVAYDDLSVNCDVLASVQETGTVGFAVHPNPTTDLLYVEAASTWSGRYAIRDLTGALVSTGVLAHNTHSISVVDLGAGIYVVETDGRTQRFVKQ